MAEAPKNPRYRGYTKSGQYPKMRGQDGRRAGKALGSMKGGGKPPKKGGGLCVQIAPLAAFPALMLLGNAIVRSFF